MSYKNFKDMGAWFMIIGLPGFMMANAYSNDFGRTFFFQMFFVGLALFIIGRSENKLILWTFGIFGGVIVFSVLNYNVSIPPYIWIFFGFFIIFLIVRGKKTGNQNSTLERESISVQANEFLEEVKNQNGLTPIQSNLITKKGENVFWEEETSLYEVRSVRQYESGSAGFRVFKGFYVGGSKGKSMSNYELTHLDNGTLSITNQRIIFNGQTLDRTITLDKVFSLNRSVKQVEISVENRQKSMIFDVSNPFIFSTVFMICNQVSDPTDLSEIKLDIQFED